MDRHDPIYPHRWRLLVVHSREQEEGAALMIRGRMMLSFSLSLPGPPDHDHDDDDAALDPRRPEDGDAPAPFGLR